MIDEKKLIEALYSRKLSHENDFEKFSDSVEAQLAIARVIDELDHVVEIVKAQPKVDEWILCSERLPEDGEEVQVWFEYFRYGEYNCLYQTHGISWAWDGEWSGFVNGSSGWYKLRIIAWQPLPEPYRGEEE